MSINSDIYMYTYKITHTFGVGSFQLTRSSHAGPHTRRRWSSSSSSSCYGLNHFPTSGFHARAFTPYPSTIFHLFTPPMGVFRLCLSLYHPIQWKRRKEGFHYTTCRESNQELYSGALWQSNRNLLLVLALYRPKGFYLHINTGCEYPPILSTSRSIFTVLPIKRVCASALCK